MNQDMAMSALKDVVFSNRDLPTIDEDLEDDSGCGSANTINKITELSNAAIEEDVDLITSENVKQSISEKGLEEIKETLAKKGKVMIATSNNGHDVPVFSKPGGIISINKPNSFGIEVVSAVKAALLMEILELKNSIVTLNPKLAPVINTTFAVYYNMSELELTTYKNLLVELLENSLFHENFIHFVEFIWVIMKTVYGHKVTNTNKVSSMMSSPHFRIVTRTWMTKLVSPNSAVGKLVILIGCIKQTFGCHDLISMLREPSE